MLCEQKPQLFQVLPNFHECFYNSIFSQSACINKNKFVFITQHETMFLCLSKCRKERAKVVRCSRVFLTNYFDETSFFKLTRCFMMETIKEKAMAAKEIQKLSLLQYEHISKCYQPLMFSFVFYLFCVSCIFAILYLMN